MKRPALVLAAVLSGCAGTSHFVPLDRIEHVDPAQYPDDDAVVLEIDQEQYVGLSVHRRRHYERVAILKPAGLSVGHFEVPLVDKSHLSAVRARSLSPRGVIRTMAVQPTSDGKQARFDVPGLEVGSVLEVEYTRERDHRVLGFEELTLSRAQPILHETFTYRAELSTTFKARLYNTQAHLESNGRTFARVELRNVPADRPEMLAPPARLSQPLLVFRLESQGRRKIASTWGELFIPALTQLDPPPQLPAEDWLSRGPLNPSEKRAFLDTAVAWLSSSTDLLSTGFAEAVRRPGAILGSHSANATEKAALLKAQLDRANIQSRYAVVSDPPGSLDPTFPSRSALGHVVIEVPAQLGIATPVVIDPTCMGCLVGELPPWTARSAERAIDLIAFWPEKNVIKTQAMRYAPSRVPPSTMARRWSVALDDTGNGQVDLVVEQNDEHAAREGWQTRDPGSARDHTAALVKRLRGVNVDSYVPTTYDPRTNVLRTEVHGRSHIATRNADRLTVSLAALHSFASPPFERVRRSGVYFRNDGSWIDEINVRAPSGWTVESLPPPRRHEAPGYAASIEVERTPDGALVRSKLEMRSGDYPPAAYADIAAATREVQNVASEVVVFKKR